MKADKRGGFELSVTTLVIIVIAVVLLILGLAFLRRIFGVATESVSVLDEQVKNKLKTMFGEEVGNIVVYNPEVNIKPGTNGFRMAVGGRTWTGNTIEDDHLSFEVTVDNVNCPGNPEDWVLDPEPGSGYPHGPEDFDAIDVDKGFVDIILNIPEGTPQCTFKIRFGIKDKDGNTARKTITVHVIRRGFF